MTIHRVVWAAEALRDAGARLISFSRGGPPLQPDERAVFAGIDAIRTCLGVEDDDAEAEPVDTCSPPPAVTMRVDRFVVDEDGDDSRVEVTWFRTGWEITCAAMRDLHLYVAADDINHTGPALDRAVRLVHELRHIASLRQAAADAESALRMEDVPF